MEKIDFTVGNRVIPITVKTSARAKRVTLRLSPAKDSVILTLPRRASLAFGMKFLNSKSAWVLANLEEDATVQIADGTVIPILGKEYTVMRKDGRGIARLLDETSELVVHCKPEFVNRRVKDFLKKFLCQKCTELGEKFSGRLGKKITKDYDQQSNLTLGQLQCHGCAFLQPVAGLCPPHDTGLYHCA